MRMKECVCLYSCVCLCVRVCALVYVCVRVQHPCDAGQIAAIVMYTCKGDIIYIYIYINNIILHIDITLIYYTITLYYNIFNRFNLYVY